MSVGTSDHLNSMDTSWLTNSLIILEAVTKKCNCPVGSHETIQEGLAQKAAAYPDRLCHDLL